MKEIEAFKREAREALKKFPFLRRMEILDEHQEAIRLRLHIREDLFIQGYFNVSTGTTNFVAVMSQRRIFGRDCTKDTWHKHPFEDPDHHDSSPEGMKAVGLTEFIEELHQILTQEDLL